MFHQHDMRSTKDLLALGYHSAYIEFDQVDHFRRDTSKRFRRRPGRSREAMDPFVVAYIDCEGTSGAQKLPDEIKNLHVAFLILVDPDDVDHANRHFASIQERYDTTVKSTLVEAIKIEPFDIHKGSFLNLVSYVAKFDWLSDGKLLDMEKFRFFPNEAKPLGGYHPRSNMSRPAHRRSPQRTGCSSIIMRSPPSTRQG